ncbi:hypothetical protein D3C86_1340740 [compost metagenome]
MRLDAEIFRGFQRELHLLHRPLLTRLRVAAHFRCGKTVKGLVIGRVNGDELTLQVGGKLGYFDAVLARDAGELVAIILRFRRFFEIDQLPGPGRHLHTGVTLFRRPFGNAIPAVEGGCITGKLTEKKTRPFDRSHKNLLLHRYSCAVTRFVPKRQANRS